MLKNFNNKEKLQIFALIGLAVFMLVFSIFIIVNLLTKDSEVEGDDVVSSLEENGEPTYGEKLVTSEDGKTKYKDPYARVRDDMPMTADEIYDRPAENDDMEELSQTDLYMIKNEAMRMFREANYGEANEYLYSKTKEYKKDGYGEELNDFYMQTSLLSTIYSVSFTENKMENDSGESADLEGITQIMDMIKDPELVLIGTLLIDHNNRPNFLLNQESLNPFLENATYQFFKMEEVTDSYMNEEMKIFYPNTKHVYRIEFKLDDYLLEAYTIHDESGVGKVHIINDLNGNSPYMTIGEWEKFYEKVDKQFEINKQLQEEMEKEKK